MRINHFKVYRLNTGSIHGSVRRRDGRANKENVMAKLARRFLQDDSGATSIEYAIIASVVSVVIVTAIAGLGSKLKGSYTSVQAALN